MDKAEALKIMSRNPHWGQNVLYDSETGCFCETGWLLCQLGIPVRLLDYGVSYITVDPEVRVFKDLLDTHRWENENGLVRASRLLAMLVEGTNVSDWQVVMSLNDSAVDEASLLRAIEYYFEHGEDDEYLEAGAFGPAMDIALGKA